MNGIQLAEHNQSHLPEKKYKCSWPDCPVACTTKQHLEKHGLQHTTPNPYHVNPPS